MDQGDRASQRSLATFIVADADGFVYPREKNLAVTDLSCPSSAGDGLNNFLDHVVGQHQLDLDLWNEIDRIFAATVKLGVAFLPSVTAGFQHRHALHADLVQSVLYGF